MRKILWTLAGSITLAGAPAWAADSDTGAAFTADLWSRWQGRVSLTAPNQGFGPGPEAQRLPSASLMGDYYIGRWLFGADQRGGFRATSGLIFGPRGVLANGQPAWSGASAFSIGSRLFGASTTPSAANDPLADAATLPYLGVGYTGLSARSGWSFNADLGLLGHGNGSAVRLGRVFTGGQSLDDAVREMRLAPLVQFGVSYSF